MKRIQFYLTLPAIIACCLVVITSCTASAANKNVRIDLSAESSGQKTLSPYFVVLSHHPGTDALPLKATSADVNIVGSIADVTVRQKYVNSGRNTLEAIYTFPMSTRAAVYAMKMTIGKRTITAKINEKNQARKAYNRAKAQGKRVSLLEQNRPNVFTMRVANIAVHDTIVVELKYTELLVPEKGEYSFVYPTVVGPRYSNRSTENSTPDDEFVASPYTTEGKAPLYKFGFKAQINSAIPAKDITCNTHLMQVSHPAPTITVVKLDKSETNGGNRDVILNYSLRGNKIESGIMLYNHGDENFFMLMVQPPKRVTNEDIPPREYIFVMDVSGSMNGFPIDISKRLLRNLISGLRTTDKFNVVLFAGDAGTMSERSVNATSENIEKAIQMIEKQNGGGGTELLTALRKAYSIPRAGTEFARTLILATDGFVDVENESFDLVRSNNENSNFFSFGIGTSVNRYLIEGLAHAGNGEPLVLESAEKAEKEADKFRQYISTPVLSNIKADFGKLDVYDMEPGYFPDMLAERPLVIMGKYRGGHAGTITISGYSGNQKYEKIFDLSSVSPQPSNAAIRTLWARQRIQQLTYQMENNSNHPSTESGSRLQKEITALGLRYSLMTQFTSFIAIDEHHIVDKNGKMITVKQALPLPKGVNNRAVGDDEMKSQEEISNTSGIISIADSKGYDEVVGKDIADVKADVIQVEEEPVLDVVEQMPAYPGGDAAMNQFIGQNMHYPATAQENGIQGTVYLRFQINKDGSVGKVEVLRSLDPACDREAIRIVKSMPRFIPGKQNGGNVAVWYTIPIKFKLN